MSDLNTSKPATEVFLLPGEYYFGENSVRIRTLLGSCVALVLWHPSLLVGGMCHFMLPGRSQRMPGPLDGKYGDEAMELLLMKIRSIGSDPSGFQGKMFGGGNMFPHMAARQGERIGLKNAEAARSLLQRHRVPIVAEAIGGAGYREILFDVCNGNVLVKLRPPGDSALVPVSPIPYE